MKADLGNVYLVNSGLSLYSVSSQSTGIIIVNHSKNEDTRTKYKIDNNNRTITWTDSEGENIRLMIISPN